jgi:DNA-binding IclR family transcriptional regulator
VAHVSRQDAQLLLAAIRVLAHRFGRPPRPAEVAELLDLPEATVRLHASALQDLGAAVLVESAFDTHLEIRNHLLIEELPAEQDDAMAADFAAFDRKKQEESQKMARLFEDGEFERKRREKLDRMDQGLRKKPRNPFEPNDE